MRTLKTKYQTVLALFERFTGRAISPLVAQLYRCNPTMLQRDNGALKFEVFCRREVYNLLSRAQEYQMRPLGFEVLGYWNTWLVFEINYLVKLFGLLKVEELLKAWRYFGVPALLLDYRIPNHPRRTISFKEMEQLMLDTVTGFIPRRAINYGFVKEIDGILRIRLEIGINGRSKLAKIDIPVGSTHGYLPESATALAKLAAYYALIKAGVI